MAPNNQTYKRDAACLFPERENEIPATLTPRMFEWLKVSSPLLIDATSFSLASPVTRTRRLRELLKRPKEIVFSSEICTVYETTREPKVIFGVLSSRRRYLPVHRTKTDSSKLLVLHDNGGSMEVQEPYRVLSYRVYSWSHTRPRRLYHFRRSTNEGWSILLEKSCGNCRISRVVPRSSLSPYEPDARYNLQRASSFVEITMGLRKTV